ncbi:MAG: tyrosine-type recombinase/integrase [Oscillospiraceae bacterium]|nr:tyrosine-type recombinase/integrase [Oscillospiraceae bacterium]
MRKRSDGRWEARYSVGFNPETGKQIQKSIYGKSQKDVQQKLHQILAEIDNGDYIEAEKITVGQWLDIWLRDYTINLKPATMSVYEEHVRVHLKPYLGNVMMDKLTPQRVQRLYNTLLRENNLSPKTIININGVFHSALEMARKLGYLKTNPLDAVVLPKVEKPPLKTMEREELVRFLDAIKGNRYEKILFVTLFTGLRQGEVLGLTWDCVNFENNTLLINKQHNRVKGEKEYKFSTLKNERIRVLTVAQEVMDVLRQQKEQQETWAKAAGSAWNNADNLVFTNELGRFIANQALYRNYKAIVKKIGLGDLRFHDLRHAYSVNSLQAGDDIKTLQENLGHATASFTLSTYAHASQGMKRESAERMGGFIQDLQKESKLSEGKGA